jgi:hypothetical protein
MPMNLREKIGVPIGLNDKLQHIIHFTLNIEETRSVIMPWMKTNYPE